MFNRGVTSLLVNASIRPVRPGSCRRGIEKEEAPTAALRELEEETARSVTVLAEASKWFTYELPDELIGTVWNGKYRGQRQMVRHAHG